MLSTCFLSAFERARFIFLSYLSLVTSLLTIMCRNFITNSFNTNGGAFNIQDVKQSAYNAAAAGGILLCIVNYALIIFVGLGEHLGADCSCISVEPVTLHISIL